jgi:cell fate regulator YaaT (PSP1 superfamily)
VSELEYLVGYGLQGDFGRFRSGAALSCRRGDRVVVRSPRGLEIGDVLRPGTPRLARHLPNTTLGHLLRLATADDKQTARQLSGRGRALLERGRALLAELDLPLELIDAEVLLDGQSAVLHHVRWADADVRPFVSTLARTFDLRITLADLTRPHAEAEQHGCGREGCGSGGCGSCGSGGCGTCGSASPAEVQAYFAELRRKMERRTPLL